jgi:hypothetical protein
MTQLENMIKKFIQQLRKCFTSVDSTHGNVSAVLIVLIENDNCIIFNELT